VSMRVRIQLPPHNYFLYHIMKTSLCVIAAYTNVMAEFRLREGWVEFKDVVPDIFAQGLKTLIDDVVKNNYFGLPVRLPTGDARRLKSKRSGYVSTVISPCVRKEVNVDCILNNYVDWFIGNPSRSLNELSRALSIFRNGYPKDPGTYSVLGSFLPEFVEGLRVFGATEGVKGSIKPDAALFRNMKVGVHSIFLGLLGLRISRVFYEAQRAYAMHLIPSDEVIEKCATKLGLSSFAGRDGRYSNIIRNLRKLRTLTSDIVTLTYVALMQHTMGEVEVFELIAGVNRWEIIGYGVRALHPLPLFIDELRNLGRRGEVVLKKLQSLIVNTLNNERTDIVEPVIRSIYQGLNGIMGVGEVCYVISRLTYANDDEERRKLTGLTPLDVSTICEAIEGTLRRLSHGDTS